MADVPELPAAAIAPADILATAFRYADAKGGTADEVVTRAKAYAVFLSGEWQKTGVTTVLVTNGGEGYAAAPEVVFSGGGGSGAAATATVTNGHVSAVAVTANGTGYTSPPEVAFTGGSGSGATAVATLAVPQ
jgi:hypothetical protein